MKPGKATVSIPFIYLKARAHRLLPTKKAHYPSSFAVLMKICNRLFKSIGVVRSIFNSEGKLISTIEEVLPGSTLFVSSLDPELIRESQNNLMSQMSDIGCRGHGGHDDSDVDFGSTIWNAYKVLSNEKSARSEHRLDESCSFKSESSLPKSESSRASVPKPKRMSDFDFLNDGNQYDESGNVVQPNEEETKTSPCSEIIKMFAEIIGSNSMNDLIESGFLQLLQWMQKLLGNSVCLEKEQLERWFIFNHALRDQQGIPVYLDPSQIFGYDIIKTYVRKIINKHRFFTTSQHDYNMRVAIVGPRESGKTHMLSVFADEVLLDFATTDNWKQTFFMFLNFRIINSFVNNPEQLYKNFVDLTLQAVAWQKPSLSKYMPLIRKTFYGVITNSNSSSGAKFAVNTQFYQENTQLANALQNIISNFSELWNNDDALAQWLTSIYTLPSAVATAVGYPKTFYFIDNFEYADVDIQPCVPPFIESKISSFNIEYVLFALNNSNFIISCENQKKFLTTLTPIEGGIDIFSGIDFVSPLGLIPNDDSDNRVIKMEIQGEPLPFLLSIDHCCGIPAFLSTWTELNDTFDESDEAGSENDEEETKMILMTYAQHAVDVLFTTSVDVYDDEEVQKSKALFVTSVYRSAKECEQKGK